MKARILATTTTLLCALSLGAAAQEDTPPEQQPQQKKQTQQQQADKEQPAAKQDKEGQSEVGSLLNTIHFANLRGIELAKFAAAKSQNAEVDQFALMVIREHQLAEAKLGPVAEKANVQLREVEVTLEEGKDAKKQSDEAPAQQQAASQRQAKTQEESKHADDDVDADDGELELDVVSQERIEAQQTDTKAPGHEEFQKEVAELRSLEGDEFNHAYMAMMADGHRMLIDQVSSAKTAIENEDVKQYVEEYEAKLKEHQAQAAELAKKLEGEGSESQADKQQKKEQQDS